MASPLGLAHDTVALVELVQRIQSERRHATEDERARLGSWMGWGSLGPAFDRRPQGTWGEIGARLRMLLGPEGTEAAAAATPHSFFTDRYIAETVWKLAIGLGFDGGRVLEPGCGSGAVIAAAPAGLTLDITGIEREPFSASAAQVRFPQANIITSALEKVSVVDDSFDLVVGNVPFSSTHIYDASAPVRFSLHNYFIWRSLQALRPGGLCLLVTSRYTLDAQRDAQREALTPLSALVGVIRLPSGAHEAASTEVVTDILVLQRPGPNTPWRGHPWLATSNHIIPGVAVNEYFASRPQRIVGTPVVEHGMYRNDELRIEAPPDLPGALERAVTSIVAEAQSRGAIYLPPVDHTVIGEHLVRRRGDGRKEGSYHVLDRQLVQIVDGKPQPVTRNIPELTALVQLRDVAVGLLEAERDLDRPDSELEPMRKELNRRYDAYVSAYGAIHRAKLIYGQADPETGEQAISRRRPPSMYAFGQDADYCVVLGLEDFDDTTQTARKARIFHHRIHTRPQRKLSAGSPAEALALCLDEHGRLELESIGRLLSIEPADVPGRLGELAYEDPTTRCWIATPEYLSGNVRTKLEEARQAAENQAERFGRNVTALEAVMPEDLAPEEIRAILGAPWVAATDIEQFCLDTFGIRPVVSHEPLTASWALSAPYSAKYSAAATSEWGTSRVDSFRLVETGLNKGIPVVYDTLSDDTRVKNVEESLAAQEKLRAIQARFSEWVWENTARATRLAAVYNRDFNSVVPRTYDGSHLSFPGMDETWAQGLYSWQRDFIWRMASSRAALCGHPVGAGKTTTEIAGAMTLRRLGLTSKAAVVVPNHLLEQITAEAQRLYPGARILMVSREDLSKERRKLFAARIATGDYDFVVMTHSGLSAIGVHPDTEKAYIDKRIAAYRQALLNQNGDDQRSQHSVKRLETAIEKMRQRQVELLDKPHDDGVTFEQLGVSYLIVDEVHLHKNLGLPTNIKSLQVKASKRAVDLEMKLRWLEEHNEGRPFASGFTATPISNSMVEAYVLAWYLDQELLHRSGLHSVDAFASTFIEFQTRVEVSPNGGSFRYYTRPAMFVNVPEFLGLFTQFTDLRGPEILNAKRPARREHTITIEPSEAMTAYVNDLVERSEAIQRGSPRDMGDGRLDNMLWVTSHGRAAALDLELVGIHDANPPKIIAVSSSMLEVYKRWQDEASFLEGQFKSLQIGFCDLGTPNENSTQVYGKLKALLIAGGIPAHGIRFIHDAKTDAAKSRLFQECRSGKVAVLLGSTSMLGTGTNIQDRCAAIHHIDAPWRPDEVEQREGRGQRPGNVYPEVEIFRYVQQRTFDAYSWQILTNKAIPFDQMRSGKLKDRQIGDLGDAALSYGQVKAAATGDPLVLEQADLNVTVAYLGRLSSAHLRARRRDGHEAAGSRQEAADCLKRADLLRGIAEKATETEFAGFSTPRGEAFADRTEIGEHIGSKVLTLLNREGGQEWIGRWSGSDVRAQVTRSGSAYVVDLVIGGDSDRNPVRVSASQEWMTKGQHWRFAVAIEQVIGSAAEIAERETDKARIALERANEFEDRARQAFPHEEELVRRTARKATLDKYTALVAASRDDAEKKAAVAVRRAELLQDAPTDFSLVPEAPTKPRAPARPQPTERTEPRIVDVPEPGREPVVEAVPLTPIPLIEPIRIPEASPVPLFAELMPLPVAVAVKKTNGHNRDVHRTDAKPAATPATTTTPAATTPAVATTLYDLMGVGDASEDAPTPTHTRRPRRAAPNREMSRELEPHTLVTQHGLW